MKTKPSEPWGAGSRRNFLIGAAVGAASAAVTSKARGEPVTQLDQLQASGAVVVSTWPFGKPANDKAFEVLKSGGAGLDAIVDGISVTESDNQWVGLGGFPNSEGIVQLDACIMSGPKHQAGSVAAVEGFKHPIAIARKVMESTPHVMLVGDGAMRFAKANGFEQGPKITPQQHAEWKKWKVAQKTKEKGHDTIAMVALTPDGHMFGGCSTSGLSYKPPGRVGDSPIIGSGLYVDDDVGGAGATGVGENVMRYCGSFQVVELMRQGLHPQEACIEVIRRIAKKDPKGYDLSIHFIALDRKGRFGGAGTNKGFEYSVACNNYSKVLEGPWVHAV